VHPGDPLLLWALLAGTVVVCALYASVGQGGASGLLALASLAGVPLTDAATAALAANVVAGSVAWWAFRRAGHFSARRALPYVAGSVPAALLAGTPHVDASVLRVVLAVALGAAAVLLFSDRRGDADAAAAAGPPTAGRAGVGVVLGGVAGLVGIGGGVFLSPILVLRRWETVQAAAATAASFVVLNSAAGLAGRALRGPLAFDEAAPFAAAALVGGLIGARLGAGRRGAAWQRRTLGFVLVVAAGRLLVG